MKIGLFQFVTDDSMPLVDLAPEIEGRGFDSLFVPEHTHIPVSRETPFPGGGDLPREYSHSLDPFVALAAAAAVTEKLRLGTGICLVIERDTITTAKEAATLDLISAGRFELGLGAGWNREEMENHGTTFETRFRKMEEQIEAMKKIWSEDEAEYHGRFVDFDPIWCWPKPVQAPGPPILLGGETLHTLRRIVALGEGWMPRARRQERIFEGLEDLRRLCEESERDPATITTTVFGARPDPGELERYADAGVTRCLLWLPPAGRDQVLPRLDRYEKLL